MRAGGIQQWNGLPWTVVAPPSLEVFKEPLDDHINLTSTALEETLGIVDQGGTVEN